MPNTYQDPNQDYTPYQLTGDDLSELHGFAQQLQSAGDPRADRVFNFIDAHSGGNSDPAAKGSVFRAPLKVTSWLQDLENTLWGGQENGDPSTETAENDGGSSGLAAESAISNSSPASQGCATLNGQTARPSLQPQPAQQSQKKPPQSSQSQQQSGQQTQQQKQGQPQPTATVVITYDKDFGIKYGSHSGLYLTGTPDGEVLYDPSGSYRQGRRGSAGLFTKDDDHVSLDDYIKYHKGTGSEVKTYTFDLSPSDVKQIYGRAQKQGDPRGLNCSTDVSQAISGIGPFSSVQKAFFPGNLASELEKIGSGRGLGGGGGSAW